MPSGSSRGERSGNNLVINLSHNTGTVIDRAIVSFDEGRTLPKLQIGSNSTKLYISQDGEEYAIAYSEKTGEMPLNFRAAENGEYTLTVAINDPVIARSAVTKQSTYAHLIDNLTGADVDLLVEFSDNPTSLIHICGLRETLSELLHLDVDIVKLPRKPDDGMQIDRTVLMYGA